MSATNEVQDALESLPRTRREWWERRDEMRALARERATWSAEQDSAFAMGFHFGPYGARKPCNA